jgi:hypothetical protein
VRLKLCRYLSLSLMYGPLQVTTSWSKQSRDSQSIRFWSIEGEAEDVDEEYSN